MGSEGSWPPGVGARPSRRESGSQLWKGQCAPECAADRSREPGSGHRYPRTSPCAGPPQGTFEKEGAGHPQGPVFLGVGPATRLR